MWPTTSIPDVQLVSGYKWIHVAVTTILSPIQDTYRRRQAIQMDPTTCIRCKRGITEKTKCQVPVMFRHCSEALSAAVVVVALRTVEKARSVSVW